MNIMEKSTASICVTFPFKAGDTIKVHARIVEGEKERIRFQGVVLRRNATPDLFIIAQGVRRRRCGAYFSAAFASYRPYRSRFEAWSVAAVFTTCASQGKAARIKAKRNWSTCLSCRTMSLPGL